MGCSQRDVTHKRRKRMTNQQLIDSIEFSLPRMPIDLREKILDAIWDVITDNRSDDSEEE